ncbi:MAG: 1-acyl-sn-glycerol-3-phosphate acyltransferase [Clostridiales bacterium]|nr:1-acyl-sn-glycerol-3-phosphate acyltransferase [Clostridiales bacterium]
MRRWSEIIKKGLNNFDKDKPLVSANPFLRFFSRLFLYFIAFPLLFLFDHAVFGLKIRGKEHVKNLKGKGAVLVCNHAHYFDCTFLGLLAMPRKAIFTSLERLFYVPVVSQLIYFLGSVPVPSSPSRMRSFLQQMVQAVKDGRLLCIYPEGELIPYCQTLRDFKDGAFTIAARAHVPVIPVVLTQRPRRGIWKLLKRKPCFTLTAGEPIYPSNQENIRRSARELYQKALEQMNEQLKNSL